ncbi:hypothetical protein E2542_SST06221 [Spatholobus suberectus]|nr:hypothetical protein E2542_SST06221 [Spatholobus suberectus]
MASAGDGDRNPRRHEEVPARGRMGKSKSPLPVVTANAMSMSIRNELIPRCVLGSEIEFWLRFSSDCPIASTRHSDLFVVSLVVRDLPFGHPSLLASFHSNLRATSGSLSGCAAAYIFRTRMSYLLKRSVADHVKHLSYAICMSMSMAVVLCDFKNWTSINCQLKGSCLRGWTEHKVSIWRVIRSCDRFLSDVSRS